MPATSLPWSTHQETRRRATLSVPAREQSTPTPGARRPSRRPVHGGRLGQTGRSSTPVRRWRRRRHSAARRSLSSLRHLGSTCGTSSLREDGRGRIVLRFWVISWEEPFPPCGSTTLRDRSDDEGQHHDHEPSSSIPFLTSDAYAELDSRASRYRSTRRSGTSHMMATLVKTSIASQGLTKASAMPHRYRTGEILPLRSRPRA